MAPTGFRTDSNPRRRNADRKKTPVWLTYCLSIHGGESAAATLRAVEQDAVRVRDELTRRGRWNANARFPLGLRIGARAIREFADPRSRRRLSDGLRDLNFFAVSINVFPYGSFHARPVKGQAYLPDWSSPRRLKYTRAAADLLAGLLPKGVSGSLSTVPLGYRGMTPRALSRAATHLAAAAIHLDALRRATGRTLGLALEPEPDCVMESAAQAVDLFRRVLFPAAEAALAGPRRAAAAAARRHLGICLDACHHAVLGESPAAAWARYDRAGIRVWKTQISAALTAPAGPRLADRLAPFRDGVYLHQTAAFQGRRCVGRWPDLPSAATFRSRAADQWRVHCHVPLGWPGGSELGTTRDAMTPAFFRRLASGACPHAEIETYTWSVLPAGLRTAALSDSVADEFEWVLDRWTDSA